MTVLNYEQFQELVGNSIEGISLKAKGEEKIIIDFFADWCAPCKMQANVLNSFNENGVKIYKVNVDDDEKLANDFGVRSIPTLLFLNPNGKNVQRVGLHNTEQLKHILNEI